MAELMMQIYFKTNPPLRGNIEFLINFFLVEKIFK